MDEAKSGLLIISSVFASGTSCRKTFTVTLLASVGLEATAAVGAGVVVAAGLASVGAAGVATVVAASVEEATLAAVVEAAFWSGGATATLGAGSEAAATTGSISVDLFTWSAAGEAGACLWLSVCGWNSLIILVSFPLGSIRLLSLMSWSCALAGVVGSWQLAAVLLPGSWAPEAGSQALRATTRASRAICFLFSVSIPRLFVGRRESL